MADSTNIDSQQSVVADIKRLFEERGGTLYGGEGVTELEHALQAALMAEQASASKELIAAALLHDIGHLLHDLPVNSPEQGIDDAHENLGAAWLKDRFSPAVVEPVRLHVASKRYLCTARPGYWDNLSKPSQVSLELQGGKMSPEEADAFSQGEHFEAAIQLRHWDDEAKIVGLKTPSLDHFLTYVEAVAKEPSSKNL